MYVSQNLLIDHWPYHVSEHGLLKTHKPLLLVYLQSHRHSGLSTFHFSFISITSTLPMTAYIKMVDIWMILVILYPFFTILLLTCRELVKNKKFIKKIKRDSKECITASRKDAFIPMTEEDNSYQTNIVSFLLNKGLLACISAFAVIYWISGITNYLTAKHFGFCWIIALW